MTRELPTDDAAGANENYVLEGLVIIRPAFWFPLELYTDWRALRFKSEAEQKELISLLASSPDLFHCPKFIKGDTVFIPFEGYRLCDGRLKLPHSVKVRYYKHFTDPRIGEFLSKRRGSKGWYQTTKIGKPSVRTVCKLFAPLENVMDIGCKLKGIQMIP